MAVAGVETSVDVEVRGRAWMRDPGFAARFGREDLRLPKAMTVGRAGRIGLLLDVLNVLMTTLMRAS